LRCELEDECQKLEEELHLQKYKVWNTWYDDLISLHNVIFLQYLQEDRQRALLQLQWNVMSDKPKEDQEINSKQVDLCNQSLCVCPHLLICLLEYKYIIFVISFV
jgi:transposase-like protein